jgi:hypothetical protein
LKTKAATESKKPQTHVHHYKLVGTNQSSQLIEEISQVNKGCYDTRPVLVKVTYFRESRRFGQKNTPDLIGGNYLIPEGSSGKSHWFFKRGLVFRFIGFWTGRNFTYWTQIVFKGKWTDFSIGFSILCH